MEIKSIPDINRNISDIMSILERIHQEENKERIALNTIEAISFVRTKGIPMSKSRLYKMVTKKECTLPHRRAGPRLIFYANELELWCESQIIPPRIKNNEPILHVLGNANNKTKRHHHGNHQQ